MSPIPDEPARIGARAAAMDPFLAMEVRERAIAMEREGARILHLEVGEPDFPAPAEVTRACVDALVGGETHYTDSRGIAELREAIAHEKSRRAGVPVGADQVIITNGTSPAMLMVFALLVEPGDEVLIGTPYYPCYPNFVRFCGGEPVFVPTRAEDGYRLDPERVERARTDRTRAIVVGSPANPTGAIQSRETLESLAAMGLPLVSDEIYAGLEYDGAEVTSALAVGGESYVLDGFSKRYAMTGFRLGYAVAPRRALRSLQILQQNLFISANHFVQRAGAAALAHGAPTAERMREAYARRRRLLVDGLRKIGFAIPTMPQGAFYVFADARAFSNDSLALAFELLERIQVATTPGIDFGEAGEGFLRFSCATAEADIVEALERLGAYLSRRGGDREAGA